MLYYNSNIIYKLYKTLWKTLGKYNLWKSFISEDLLLEFLKI